MKNPFLLSLVSPLVLLLATSASAQGIKWHPGHYMQLGAGDSRWQIMRAIDEIGNESAIEGVVVKVRWYDLEKSKGVYDFSALDAYLARAKAQPKRKRLVVRILDREFNTDSRYGIVPGYLLSSTYHGGVARSQTGYVARLWEWNVMDRLIALHRAVARRYDDDPYFEGVTNEESTLALASPVPWSYTNEKLVAQYRRLIWAVRSAAPHTNFFFYANWIGSPSLMDELMQVLVNARAVAASPDVFPGRKTLAQKVETGEYGADYRWILSLASSIEIEELKSHTPWQIHNWGFDEVHLHHIFWARNTWAGPSSSRWYTGILPFLRNNPQVRNRCPDSYGWCVN